MKIREGNKIKGAEYYAVNLCLKSSVIKRERERVHLGANTLVLMEEKNECFLRRGSAQLIESRDPQEHLLCPCLQS